MIARLHDLAPFEPRLVVGACPTTLEDIAHLAELGVTGLLSLQSDADLEARGLSWSRLWQTYLAHGILASRVPIRDFDQRALQRHLDEAVAALDALLARDRRVYVHCTAGLNRSTTVVLAHLSRAGGLEAALEVLLTRHPEAIPYVDVVARWRDASSRR